MSRRTDVFKNAMFRTSRIPMHLLGFRSISRAMSLAARDFKAAAVDLNGLHHNNSARTTLQYVS
jgi:hypothetical protein